MSTVLPHFWHCAKLVSIAGVFPLSVGLITAIAGHQIISLHLVHLPPKLTEISLVSFLLSVSTQITFC